MDLLSDDIRSLVEITPTQWESKSLFLSEKIKAPEIWDSVPLFNHGEDWDFRDHQLVRFVGMVQDMLEPEMFLKQYEIRNRMTGESAVKSGMFCDVIEDVQQSEIVEDSAHNERSDRETFYCVSIPGVNQWVLEFHKKKSELQSAQTGPSKSHGKESEKLKRTKDEMLGMSEDGAEEARNDLVAVEDPDGSLRRAKKEPFRPTAPEDSSRTCKTIADLNHPLGDPRAKACFVKIYDWEAGFYQVNDMVEIIGFLSNNPLIAAMEADDGTDGTDSANTTLPPSLVPRLHAIAMKKVKHVNPLVGLVGQAGLSDASSTFDEIIHLFTQMMMGDSVCAEYLLYAMVGNVYLQHNDEGIGQLSVNIHGVPLVPSFVESVYSILTDLVEKSHRIYLRVSDLNEITMIPRKDYEANRLNSGQLQLAANTVLFVDETKLEEGRLVNKGCLNMAALKNICEKQRISYDFVYYPLEYQTNISMLVFSSGCSLLPCAVDVKMSPCPESVKNMDTIFEAAKFHILKEPMLTKFRKYLTLVRHLQYDISDDLQELLQENFVQLRKDDPKFSAPDFHRLLVIARLASLCRGEQTLSIASWERAVALDKQRADRSM